MRELRAVNLGQIMEIITRSCLSICLSVALGLTLASPAWAGGGFMVTIGGKGSSLSVRAKGLGIPFGEDQSYEPVRSTEPGFVIIDATPAEAQVFLDGRLLGSARLLVARGFPVAPGRHAIEIVQRGYRPCIAQFIVEPGWPRHIRAALRPE